MKKYIAFLVLAVLIAGGAAAQTKTLPAKKSSAKTAATKAQPAKAQDASAEASKAQDVYTLKAPLGAVKFNHKVHAANFKCDSCHHASKPEKPNKTKYQACTDCHTNPPQAGMKTKLQAAFHNPMATAGVCIDCHKAEAAKGKKTPSKCADCHKKENV